MLDTLVKRCPYVLLKPVKNLYGSIPYEARLGKKFYEMYSFLQEAREWTAAQREEYQFAQLQKLLRHAYQNVPYYRRVFDERGLTPDGIRDFTDLRRLPYLTKQLVRENAEDLVAINYKKSDLRYLTTGGTTGLPMGFYDQKKVSDCREWAFVTSLWKAVGYDVRTANRSVILRGQVPARGYYEYKGLNLILSSCQMRNEYIADYVQKILEFDPDYIQAYPSSAGILANYILRNGLKLRWNNLKAVICSSEVLSDMQRARIAEAFRTRVYSFYGHSERSCLAGECETGTDYHLVGEYGYTELIGRSGGCAAGENEPGEIVCTGFNNYAMPFIRYRTGDIGINTLKQCACGRSRQMLKGIQGRAQDYLFGRQGEPVPFIFSDNVVWPVMEKINAYQYVQDFPGRVRLDIEPAAGLGSRDLQAVKQEFYRWYPSMEVEVQVTAHIEKTKSGKFRYLIQRVSADRETTGESVLIYPAVFRQDSGKKR